MKENAIAEPTNNYHVIGQGANRVCVVDPEDADFCLKFDRAPAQRRLVKGWRQLLRFYFSAVFPALNENVIEWRAYQSLYARFGRSLDDKVAACTELKRYGRSWMLRCQCIRQENGGLAPSIHHLISRQRNDYSAKHLCEAVDEFVEWLVKHNIPLFDLNAGNFVVVADGHNHLKLICVDVKSVLRSKESIPVSRWVNAWMHKKIRRRAGRLKQRIHDQLEPLNDKKL